MNSKKTALFKISSLLIASIIFILGLAVFSLHHPHKDVSQPLSANCLICLWTTTFAGTLTLSFVFASYLFIAFIGSAIIQQFIILFFERTNFSRSPPGTA